MQSTLSPVWLSVLPASGHRQIALRIGLIRLHRIAKRISRFHEVKVFTRWKILVTGFEEGHMLLSKYFLVAIKKKVETHIWISSLWFHLHGRKGTFCIISPSPGIHLSGETTAALSFSSAWVYCPRKQERAGKWHLLKPYSDKQL